MELTAPRVAASSSLGALAFAALSPAGPAPDSAPEAQWLAAHREGREPWLDDLPAAFAAWLKDPPPEDRRLVALASAIGLTRAETLAVALSRAAETDAMAGRVLAWLQTPVGGTRPLAGLVASLAERFGDPAPLTSLAAGAARSIGLLQADNETRSMPERSLIVPQPIVLALADPPVLSWPGLRVGMPDPPPLPPSLREAAASRARALSRRAASGIVVRSGHPREAKAVAAEICLHLGARAALPGRRSARWARTVAVAGGGDSRDLRGARPRRAPPAEGHSRLERAGAGRRGTRRQLRARG